MGKPGSDRAPSPVNPGNSATRQEMCQEGPPTRSRCGRYHMARPGGPPQPKSALYPENQIFNLQPQTSNLNSRVVPPVKKSRGGAP